MALQERNVDRIGGRLLVFLVAVSIGLGLGPRAGSAQVVDPAKSYFVPLAGPEGTPMTGMNALRFFRACPNNDGGSSLPQRARIKIQLLTSAGDGVQGLVPYLKVNGGTPAQGFTGTASDSIIANNVYNTTPPCTNLDRVDATVPNYRYIDAVQPTDLSGVTYIWLGFQPDGVGGEQRNPIRKWGHYDCEIPVYVMDSGVEVKILGKLTEAMPNTLQIDPACGGTPTFGLVLRIKNLDHTGGLTTAFNQGEIVSAADFNAVANTINLSASPVSFWRDFDWSGGCGSTCGVVTPPCTNCPSPPCNCITAIDLNIITAHVTHDCDTPNNP